jgi:hypothetical protein
MATASDASGVATTGADGGATATGTSMVGTAGGEHATKHAQRMQAMILAAIN